MQTSRILLSLCVGVVLAAGGCEEPPGRLSVSRQWVTVGAARSTSPAAAPAAQPAAVSAMERAVFDGLNRLRRERGLRPLRLRADLSELARRHCRDVARTGRLSHFGSDGATLADRAERMRIAYRVIGENLAWNVGYADPVARALDGWMRSPSHRENMLRADYQDVGVGAVVLDAGGGAWFGAVFCRRPGR